jgi:hypothetical protein
MIARISEGSDSSWQLQLLALGEFVGQTLEDCTGDKVRYFF